MMARASFGGWAVLLTAAAIAPAAQARLPVQRDMEGYAVATCLAQQPSDYLKDQADGWGAMIVQRGRGSPAALKRLADAVRAETARAALTVIRDEAHPMEGKPLPIAFCAELVDRPRVRAAILRAMTTLGPAYRRR